MSSDLYYCLIILWNIHVLNSKRSHLNCNEPSMCNLYLCFSLLKDDLECQLCKFLIEAIDTLVGENKTVVALNSTLLDFCNNLPGELKDTVWNIQSFQPFFDWTMCCYYLDDNTLCSTCTAVVLFRTVSKPYSIILITTQEEHGSHTLFKKLTSFFLTIERHWTL